MDRAREGERKVNRSERRTERWREREMMDRAREGERKVNREAREGQRGGERGRDWRGE